MMLNIGDLCGNVESTLLTFFSNSNSNWLLMNCRSARSQWPLQLLKLAPTRPRRRAQSLPVSNQRCQREGKGRWTKERLIFISRGFSCYVMKEGDIFQVVRWKRRVPKQWKILTSWVARLKAFAELALRFVCFQFLLWECCGTGCQGPGAKYLLKELQPV